jgi:hypothetical protein
MVLFNQKRRRRMKPKEKAKELVDKMYQYQWRKDTIEFRNAKQCALIAVDEMLKEHFGDISDYGTRRYYFLKEVKEEIEKL